MRVLRLAILLAAPALLAGLSPALSAQERSRVVVLRTGNAAPYVRALEGVRTGLRDSAAIEVRSIDVDDPNQGLAIEALGPDVLLPLGSKATRWAMEETQNIPIVFAMVLHPVASSLVASLERPGGRVTGAALDIPPALQFEALRDVIGAQRVAVLYDPEKTARLIKEAKVAARRSGVELLPIAVAGPKSLERSLKRIDDSFDALWSVADPTVMSRGAAERVLLHSLREGVPFIGLSEQFVRAGALMAMVTSDDANGRQAAALVRRVLAGRSPGSLPVALPEEIEILFNPRTAERLNVSPRASRPLSLRALR